MARIIMTSGQLVERLHVLANRRTFYKNKYPYNLCRINEDGRTSADCVNLYKALLNGYDVTRTTVGYYQSDLSNTGDCTESGLLNQCSNVTTDFTNINDGVVRALWMNGHFGGSIPMITRNGKNYNVVECTPSFGGGIVYSWCDTNGTRRAYQGGPTNGRWLKNGLFTPWVDYNGVTPVPPKPDPAKLPILKQGDQGMYVKYLQELLIANGYDPNGVDGYFGPGCEQAVKKFQKDNGLSADGIVGPGTWNALLKTNTTTTTAKPATTTQTTTSTKKDVSKYPMLRKGSTGAYVKELQTLLKNKGYNPNGIDGNFGPGTESAVKKFQKDRKLTVDGIVGQNTWNALING